MPWRKNIFTSASVCHVVSPAGRNTVLGEFSCVVLVPIFSSVRNCTFCDYCQLNTPVRLSFMSYETLIRYRRSKDAYTATAAARILPASRECRLAVWDFYYFIFFWNTYIPWSLPLVTADEWQYHMICQTNWNSHISLKNNWFVTISAFHKNHSVGGNIGCATYQQYTVQIKLL